MGTGRKLRLLLVHATVGSHSKAFFIRYTHPYRWHLAVAISSMLLLVGVQLVASWIIRTLIAAFTRPEAPLALTQIAHLALLALGVYTLRAGLQFVKSYLTHVAGWGGVAKVRRVFVFN